MVELITTNKFPGITDSLKSRMNINLDRVTEELKKNGWNYLGVIKGKYEKGITVFVVEKDGLEETIKIDSKTGQVWQLQRELGYINN